MTDTGLLALDLVPLGTGDRLEAAARAGFNAPPAARHRRGGDRLLSRRHLLNRPFLQAAYQRQTIDKSPHRNLLQTGDAGDMDLLTDTGWIDRRLSGRPPLFSLEPPAS